MSSYLSDINTCETCGFEWFRQPTDCPVCKLSSCEQALFDAGRLHGKTLSRLDTAEQKLAKLHEIATTDPLCSKHGWQGNEGDPCAYCERDAALLRLDQIMKDGTEYAQDMEARLIKRVAQIDELQSQLDSVLVLLREVSESETWELGTDLNRRIEAAIKAPK